MSDTTTPTPAKKTGAVKGTLGVLLLLGAIGGAFGLFNDSKVDYTITRSKADGPHGTTYQVGVDSYQAGDAKKISEDLYVNKGDNMVVVWCKGDGTNVGIAWNEGFEGSNDTDLGTCS